MQTNLIPVYQESTFGQRAEEILRSCVHCGFCNATCPTYQVLGDELDGPRGRIYQIKQLLEGGEVNEETRVHLDRCLTCRACETTCPSGVQYHELLEIGKQVIDEKLPARADKLQRKLVHAWLIRPWLFALSLKLGRLFRPLLPSAFKAKVPPRSMVELAYSTKPLKEVKQERGTILLFSACVQKAVTPQVDEASRIVFEALGYRVEEIADAGCCGALSQHTSEQAKAKALARQNIDAWSMWIERNDALAVVANASGCGVFIKEYPELFEPFDPYFEKAKWLSERCKDPIELIDEQGVRALQDSLGDTATRAEQVLAYHPPCTLQHGQKLSGSVEALFRSLGLELVLPQDSHLCCGSAGTYSLLQPELSETLRSNKLRLLDEIEPDLVLSANIGCQSHLAAKSSVPVVHWMQYLAQLLTNSTKV
jgi:glycolate oxidase iron-sulfur subunit